MFFCLHLRKCCSCFCSFLWGINYSGFIALTGVSGNSNWRNSKTLSSFPSFLLLQIPLWKTQGSVLGLSQVPIHLPNEVPSARAPKSSSGDSESVAALPSPAPLCPALLYRHLSLTPEAQDCFGSQRCASFLWTELGAMELPYCTACSPWAKSIPTETHGPAKFHG